MNDWTFTGLALVVSWAILSFPWLSGQFTIPWDAKAHFLPQVQFLASSLANGESPFWTPFIFSGHPQIADPQSMIFSPPFLLLAAIDPQLTPWAFDATLLLTILVSAGAMLCWLADRRWHPAAALVTALSFAFGAAMAWRIQHVGQVLSLCYLPIVLFVLDRAIDRRSVGYGALAGCAAAVLVLGRDQVALLEVYFLIGYVAWRFAAEPRQALSNAKPLFAAAITGAVIVAIPVTLTFLLAGISNRPAIDLAGAERGSLHPALLLTAFSSNVFGSSGAQTQFWGPPSPAWTGTGLYIAQNMGVIYFGALPLAALILGSVSGKYFHRDVRYIIVALAIAVIYALGRYTPLFSIMHAVVPGVDLYRRPADAVFVLGFLASLLSGYAIHRLLTDTRPFAPTAWTIALASIVPILGYATLLALAVHFGTIGGAAKTIIGSAAILVVSAASLVYVAVTRPDTITAVMLFAAVLTADLAWSNGPGGATALPMKDFEVLTSSGNDTIARLKELTSRPQSSTRRDRIELVGFGFHWPNASLTHGLENTLGYNPVRLQLYAQATGAEDHVGSPDQRKFSPLFPSYRSQLADLLGLRYIATSVPIEQIDPHIKGADLDFVGRTSEGFIYENPRAFPRVIFANRATSGDFAGILKDGTWPAVDFKDTVVLDASADHATRRPGHAWLEAYHNTAITVESESPDGGWVVLNDIWHPWWFAEVDGNPAPILRANVLFRAVEVGPGRHTVRFSFEPLKGALAQMLSFRVQR